jgi:RHS repeat-associated protein
MRVQTLRLRCLHFGLFLAAIFVWPCSSPLRAQGAFVRSDANVDGRLDISDGIFGLTFLFLGGTAPACRDSADANDDGRLDLSDSLFTFGFLFLGGSQPLPPWPSCGLDPTEDGLSCDAFAFCQVEPPSPLPRPTGPQENSLDDADAESVQSSGHVVLSSGEMRLDRVDLQFPGRGEIHFSMLRRYRSRLDHDGVLGHGWDFRYAERLDVAANGDVIRANGRGHVDTWTRNQDGSYIAPPGHFRTLRRLEDGSFVLRSPGGLKRHYDAQGRLTRYQDRNGNQMLFIGDAQGRLDLVVDVYGREIDFVYELAPDGVERLARIVDFEGREVEYSYDVHGDLIAVRSPVVLGTSHGNDFPQGRTERYEYFSEVDAGDLGHNLIAVTFPQEVASGGEPGLSFEYGSNPADALAFDRVLAETEGGSNGSGVPAGGTRRFAYAAIDDGAATLRVTHTERNGNLSEFEFDDRGRQIRHRRLTRGLRDGEPPHYETTSQYDDDHLLVRRVFPAGSEMRAVYDSAGPRRAARNLLELRQVAGPRGGGEDIVWRFTYEPLFQQISTVTDPRGNSASFTPPLGAPSAERYTTAFFYDYQESGIAVPEATEFEIALGGIARGLGDLNGDARIDRFAGDAVRVVNPVVLLRPESEEAAILGSVEQAHVWEQRWNERGQILSTIDPEGNVSEYHYYPENDPDGDGVPITGARIVLSGEPRGYLRAEVSDAATSPRRSSATPPVGLETLFEYDAVGHVIGVRSPRGVVTGFEVTALDEVVRVVRGENISAAIASRELISEGTAFAYLTRFHYDANGRVVLREEENRGGATPGVGEFVARRFVHDILGNIVEAAVEVDATREAVQRLRYDPNELLVAMVSPEGNRVEVSYDERNLPLDVTVGAGSPEASTTRRDYDLNGNILRLIDAEDSDGDSEREVHSVVYDGFDRVIEVRDPLGNRRLTDFDPISNAVRQRFLGHPAGLPGAAPVSLADIAFHHDELGRIYRIDEALFLSAGFVPARSVDLQDGNDDGLVTTFIEHDALSRPTFVVDDDGQVTRSIYDGAGRQVEWRDAAGNAKLTEYDAGSNPVEVRSIEVSTGGIVPAEEWLTFLVWDQLDRLVRVSADHTLRFTYDSRDQLIATSDAKGDPIADPLDLYPGLTNTEGNTRRMVFDGRGLVTAVIADLRQGGLGGAPLDVSNPHNPDGRVELRYDYDLDSRLIAIVDDNGNTTRFVHDALDRIVEKEHADGSKHTLSYDRDSDLVRIDDPNGTRITQIHDVLHRLVRREIAPASGVRGTTAQTFEYDGLSRVTEAVDDGSPDGAQIVRRVFDSLGRLLEEDQNGAVCSAVWSGDGKRLSLTYPDGGVLEYDHDAIDREIEISRSGDSVARFEWIGPGRRLLRRTHGNGTSLSLLDEDEAATGYDIFQRIARIRHVKGLAEFADREYEYDRANRRTAEVHREDGGRTDSFVFDSIYRLVRAVLAAGGIDAGSSVTTDYLHDGVGNRRETVSGAQSVDYTPNALNEYIVRDGVTRLHDRNGNLIDDGARRYRYDWKNRLVEVDDAATSAPIARYSYDALDRRVARTIAAAGVGDGAVAGTTRYVFDDRWRVIDERRPQNARATYVWGDGMDELIQASTIDEAGGAPVKLWAHQDARSDIVALTDAGGGVAASVAYDEFGRHRRSGLASTPYLFQGQRRDPETGLYQFRNRYYDPASGRFLTRDPVWDTMNAGNSYTFVGNDPVTRRDPLGLDGTEDVITGILDYAGYVSPILAFTDAEKNWKDWVGYSGDGVQRDSTLFAFGSGVVEETPRSIAYGSVVLVDKITLEKFDTLHEAAEQTYVELGFTAQQKAIHQGTAGVTAFAIHCVSVDKAVVGLATRIVPLVKPLQGALGACGRGGVITIDSAHAARSIQLVKGTGVRGFFQRLWYRAVSTPRDRTLVHEAVHRFLMGVPWAGRFQSKIESISWWFYSGGKKGWQLGKLMEEWLANTVSNGNFVRNIFWSIRNYWHLPRWLGGGTTATGEAIVAADIIPFAFTRVVNGLSAAIEYALVGRIFKSHYNEALGEPSGVPTIRVEIPPEPLVTAPDTFVVAPGLKTSLDVGANDTGTAGAQFVLVSLPQVHSDQFVWNGDGKFSIAPLTGSGPLTFSYKVVRGDEESETTTVTVELDPALLYRLQAQTDPMTGEVFFEVPCLVLDNLHYPIYQFRLTNNPADVCVEPHWHGHEAFPLEAPSQGKPDPDSPRCGYGRLAEVPQESFRVSDDAWQQFLIDHIPPI